MNPRNFFAELKRRNVYKVAVAYAVVGWLVMQVAATIVPALHLPEKAFEWLQISFDTHDTGMLAPVVDPMLNSLRDDPRYKAFVARMNFPPVP
jgi:hypothetical protein